MSPKDPGGLFGRTSRRVFPQRCISVRCTESRVPALGDSQRRVTQPSYPPRNDGGGDRTHHVGS
jgi:hypothetical protein